eukprot:TRINITY_DN6878_c0_g1_i2.p1 TRINITY_DN6878_c0_g1~~TRINITY_DN6878_c0_g1_i2.p1  ORF type:complete len:628 (+),score=177.15 TRINITY_DN6878_c0_g1_i2:70-1884(+)
MAAAHGLRGAALRVLQRCAPAAAAHLGPGYDYIVVGAGSAGCCLAERLSRDPAVRVLLLEAGPSDGWSWPAVPWAHIPVGYFRVMHSAADWRFCTDPARSGLSGRSIAWPRGRVLGGSSSMNGLLYVRGQPEDYDGWAALGCAGWDWESVRPVFSRMEGHDEAPEGPPDYFGVGGPLAIQGTNYRSPLCEAIVAAVAAQRSPAEPEGVPVKRGAAINGASQHGVGYFQQTARAGFRCSSAVAYLNRTRGRANLDVVVGAPASRIRVCPDLLQAWGVDYSSGGGRHTAVLRGPGSEVVLAAGAIGSPHLLQLSGVGTPPELAARCDWLRPLPGAAGGLPVGENLQDHLQVRAVFRSKFETLNSQVRTLWGRLRCALRFAAQREGPMAMAASQVAAFVRSGLSDSPRPDIQFHFQPLSATHGGGPGKLLDPFDAFTASVCQLRPESRGRVRARTPFAADHPRIEPRYLSHPVDQRTAVAGLRYARRVADTAPLAAVAGEEVAPGSRWQSDEELLESARRIAETIYHPCGTCSMGPPDSPAAVVDPRLRVRGVKGLRVADASVMPNLTSGNTNAPTIMIAERAADMLLADRPPPPSAGGRRGWGVRA